VPYGSLRRSPSLLTKENSRKGYCDDDDDVGKWVGRVNIYRYTHVVELREMGRFR